MQQAFWTIPENQIGLEMEELVRWGWNQFKNKMNKQKTEDTQEVLYLRLTSDLLKLFDG